MNCEALLPSFKLCVCVCVYACAAAGHISKTSHMGLMKIFSHTFWHDGPFGWQKNSACPVVGAYSTLVCRASVYLHYAWPSRSFLRSPPPRSPISDIFISVNVYSSRSHFPCQLFVLCVCDLIEKKRNETNFLNVLIILPMPISLEINRKWWMNIIKHIQMLNIIYLWMNVRAYYIIYLINSI